MDAPGLCARLPPEVNRRGQAGIQKGGDCKVTKNELFTDAVVSCLRAHLREQCGRHMPPDDIENLLDYQLDDLAEWLVEQFMEQNK